MSTGHGRFVWYEIMTSDIDAAERFYRDVVGWEIKDAGMDIGPYRILHAGPRMVGGLMPIPDDARKMGVAPSWMGYVAVDDVDRYATKVTDAGGRIYRAPGDIPGIGRFSVVGDPGGAPFILFRSASDESPAEAPPGAPGHVGWHELHAGDREKAVAFYTALFGWTKAEAHDMGPAGIYQLFSTGGPSLGGIFTKARDEPAPYWLYYVNVEAADAARERVLRGGGKVLNGPTEVPGGSWILNCLDPQGAAFALVAPRR